MNFQYFSIFFHAKAIILQIWIDFALRVLLYDKYDIIRVT